MPVIPDISLYQVNKTIVDVDLDGVVIPGLTGEFFWREEGGRTATAGRYSFSGIKLFMSWGYRGEAHCAWTSYFAGGQWSAPHPGCPRITRAAGALLIDGRFRLPYQSSKVATGRNQGATTTPDPVRRLADRVGR